MALTLLPSSCPTGFPPPVCTKASRQTPPSTHRPVALVLLGKLPIVVVVESGVGLHGLLLTQLLAAIFDTVHGHTGNLGVKQGESAQVEVTSESSEVKFPKHKSWVACPKTYRKWIISLNV